MLLNQLLETVHSIQFHDGPPGERIIVKENPLNNLIR